MFKDDNLLQKLLQKKVGENKNKQISLSKAINKSTTRWTVLQRKCIVSQVMLHRQSAKKGWRIRILHTIVEHYSLGKQNTNPANNMK